MTITFTIPLWLCWTLGVLLGLVVVGLAVIGIAFIIAFGRNDLY